MENNKGITLIALTIMIIIILILAAVTTTTGLNVIKESRYNKAVAETKVMQTKVNELYDEYKNPQTGVVSLPANVNGIDISDVTNEEIINEIEEAYNSVYNKSFNKTEIKEDGFRFYSSDYIKNTLDIDGVDGNYIININTRTVIYIEGIEKDGIAYFALSQIEGEQFNLDYVPSYVVRFDANGGTVSEKSKIVIPGEEYGDLPTPTREGYTFLGWNGKNKFIQQGTIIVNQTWKEYLVVTYDNENQTFSINGSVPSQGNLVLSKGPINIEAGENITFSAIHVSGNAVIGSGSGITYSYSIFSQDNSKYVRRTDNLGFSSFPEIYKFSGKMIQDSGGVNNQVMLQLWRQNTVFNNYKIKIQLEEGDTATEYEPYYVTSDIIVTQAKDHTLKAIWQEN